jgi:hypothetical protein
MVAENVSYILRLAAKAMRFGGFWINGAGAGTLDAELRSTGADEFKLGRLKRDRSWAADALAADCELGKSSSRGLVPNSKEKSRSLVLSGCD